MEKKIKGIIKKRYIGYFDIMGFKSFIEEEGVEEVYRQLEKVQVAVSNQERYEIGYGEAKVKSVIFSDSFFFFTENDTEEDLKTIIFNMSFIQGILFKIGLPFRGAVAFGDTIIEQDIDKPLFLGKPLIYAYLLEQELNFYGILVHHSIMKKIEGYESFDFPFIKEARVKLKGSTAFHELIVPFNLLIPGDSNETIENYKDLYQNVKSLKVKSSGANRVYIDNTLEMYEKIYNSHFKKD